MGTNNYAWPNVGLLKTLSSVRGLGWLRFTITRGSRLKLPATARFSRTWERIDCSKLPIRIILYVVHSLLIWSISGWPSYPSSQSLPFPCPTPWSRPRIRCSYLSTTGNRLINRYGEAVKEIPLFVIGEGLSAHNCKSIILRSGGLALLRARNRSSKSFESVSVARCIYFFTYPVFSCSSLSSDHLLSNEDSGDPW